MAIDKEYVEDLREMLSAIAFQDADHFRSQTQIDVNQGYSAEVEHLGKSIFGRGFTIRATPTTPPKEE